MQTQTMNELIINALSDIAPVYPYELDEPSEEDRDVRRILFNYDVRGLAFADNRPFSEQYFIQVHYFCPHEENSLDARRRITVALFENGFTFPEEVTVVGSNISDMGSKEEQHYTFETERKLPARIGDADG